MNNSTYKIGMKIFLSIVVVILMIVGGCLILLFKALPPARMVAALESNADNGAPKVLKWLAGDSEVERDYSTLPEIMVLNDGTKVEDITQFGLRKEEMIQLFSDNVYGSVPNMDYEVSFEVLEEDTSVFNDTAIRKQVEITITTELGESKSLMLLYLPKSEEPVPVFIGLNFFGNTTSSADSVILPSYGRYETDEETEEKRGEKAERWPAERLVSEGYGLATINRDDFVPDNKKTYNSRLIRIFGGDTEEAEFKAISAWAFGLSRGIDYLVSEPAVDATKIITVGHSRLGKTALWAAAQDERVALAISNGSGNSGAALSRSSAGETVKIINNSKYWFIDNYKQYGGNENELPVDQHMLLASIAPRKVYVSSAKNDLWADPYGEFEALKLASRVYELYGSEYTLTNEYTDMEEVYHTPFFGYHNKNGRHSITSIDWKYFIDYANKYIK